MSKIEYIDVGATRVPNAEEFKAEAEDCLNGNVNYWTDRLVDKAIDAMHEFRSLGYNYAYFEIELDKSPLLTLVLEKVKVIFTNKGYEVDSYDSDKKIRISWNSK